MDFVQAVCEKNILFGVYKKWVPLRYIGVRKRNPKTLQL